MSSVAVECVVSIPSLLGENPFWVPAEKRLYWLDLMKPAIYRFDPATGKNTAIKADLGSYISGMVPRRKGGWILVREDGLSALDLTTGRVQLQPLVHPEPDQPDNMLNDAKCDRQGRLWTGSLDKKETHPSGNHYVIDKKLQVTRVADSLICSNGPAFSPDGRIAYLADSNGRAIYRLYIDLANGAASPKTPFVTDIPAEEGLPDGMTVDAEGYLWSARWDGGRVVRHAPDGSVDREIMLPVPRVTSVAFGGDDLSTLYITTASTGLSEEQLKAAPLSGSLFACRPGARGLAEPAFAG
jgi:sugar lactone lactonase YvrE